MSIRVLLSQPILQEGYDYLHTHGFETINGQGTREYVKLTDNREEVFRTSDYISLHITANAETIYSISDREFDWMKPNAFLINTA